MVKGRLAREKKPLENTEVMILEFKKIIKSAIRRNKEKETIDHVKQAVEKLKKIRPELKDKEIKRVQNDLIEEIINKYRIKESLKHADKNKLEFTKILADEKEEKIWGKQTKENHDKLVDLYMESAGKLYMLP